MTIYGSYIVIQGCGRYKGLITSYKAEVDVHKQVGDMLSNINGAPWVGAVPNSSTTSGKEKPARNHNAQDLFSRGQYLYGVG